MHLRQEDVGDVDLKNSELKLKKEGEYNIFV